MADYDFKPPSQGTRGRFGSKSDPGSVQAPGANAAGSKLVVRSKDDPAQADTDGTGLFAPPSKEADLGPQKQRRRKRFHANEEISVYEEQLDERYGMDRRGKMTLVVGICLIVCFVIALLVPAGFVGLNSTNPTISGFLSGISSNIEGILAFFSGEKPSDPMGYKFFRYLIIIIAGVALGISGGVYQSALKNSLASPTTLGVIAGGTLGATIYVIFCVPETVETSVMQMGDLISYYDSLSLPDYIAAVYGQAGFTLLGCFVVVAFVVLVATIAGHGKINNAVLIVTGQVIVVLANSIMTLVRTFYSSGYGSESKATMLQSVRSASFSNLYGPMDLVLMGVPVLICVGVIIAMRMRLNALTFTDEEARSMGLSTTATRNVMVGACTVMTAFVVAFCGSISFVGFVVPHLTRRVVGPNFKYYIPATALVGALFLVVCYGFSSVISLEAFGGVRLLTSVLGGVAFIVIALRSRGRGVSDGF